jgi:hypothetical protein
MPMMNKLPLVGRIQGATLEERGSPDQSLVIVQYSSRTGELCELEMLLEDAMYLLNALREIEKDSQK